MEYKEYGIARRYAEQLATQMRKGLLSYLVLILAREPIYTSDIIRRLGESGMTVVEGTIYPLLLRLQRDGLLTHTWREDTTGKPPRKYYAVTELGQSVANELDKEIKVINKTMRTIGKETK